MNRRANRPTLVSLFAGAGGLDVGLEQAGFQTIYANEIESYACESLRANRLLRTLRTSQFEYWFKQQITEQRCYAQTSSEELFHLCRRLYTGIEESNNYLEGAHIAECDVRSLAADEILSATGMRVGEIDLVAGGPPCQPFSRAGKRELVESDTGQLFREFVRLVAELRPRFFLFENVKGLVQHKADVVSLKCPICRNFTLADFDRRDALKEAERATSRCSKCGHAGTAEVMWEKRRSGSLEIIEHEFSQAGYRCASTILNAADFGAPQMRERLFIVGSRDGETISWPRATHCETAAGIYRAPSLFDRLDTPQLPWRTVNQELYGNGHWRYGRLNPSRAVLWVKNVVRPHDEPVTWTLDRPAPTIGAHQAAKLAVAPDGVPEAQLLRQQWHVLGRRQGDTKPVPVKHEYLTDEELLRLQTFPTSWYLYGTRMQRAFQIGNAVPPALGRAVGTALVNQIGFSAEVESNTGMGNAINHAASI